jgi:hypothetical protein
MICRAGGVILLTVLRKIRSAETAEVARAVHAHKVCEPEHGPAHDTFDQRCREMTNDHSSYDELARRTVRSPATRQ